MPNRLKKTNNLFPSPNIYSKITHYTTNKRKENFKGHEHMNYTLLRSNRKTIAIRITEKGTVEVRAPYKISESEIDRLVHTKETWIMEHLEARKQINEQKSTFSLNYGDSVLFMGKEYPICAKSGHSVGFDESCFYMPENLNDREIKFAVIQIYKMLAKNVLTDKVIKYARKMLVIPTDVKINSAKKRWGSCSGKNSINFSWRLIMAQDDIIDYVVIHELAHICEHNHSIRFWTIVENILPDYKEKQEGLKILQRRLSKEDWD